MISTVLIVTAVFLYYLYFQRRYRYWERRGIPGPKAIPFAGTFFSENTGDGRVMEKEYLRKYGEVFGTYTGGERVFNTCVPEHIKQVLGDVNTFQNFGLFFIHDRYVQKSMFFQNGSKWKEHRAAMTHHFTSRKLKSLLTHFESAADNFINNVEFLRKTGKTDVIEIKKMCKCYAVDMISKYVFAVDIDSFKQDQQNSEFSKLALRVGDVNIGQIIMLNFLPRFIWEPLKLNIFDVEPFNKLGDLFKDMVSRRDPGLRYNDLTELLQDQIRDGKLKDMTEDEIIANCLVGFFAGTDTTSNALTKVFYYLVTEPAVKERLYEELKRDFKDGITYEGLMEHQYLDAFINECLRIGQSVLSLDKLATKDVQLGEYKIEKGTVIHLITYLNHTNDRYFPDADKFDVNRFLDKSSNNPNEINRNDIYLPFSSGNRQCIGMRFALLELKYLVARVLLEYDIFRPNGFKLEEVSRRRFSNPIRMNVGLRKRTT